MNIKWHSVTWYSKLLAVALFVMVLVGGFVLGVKYQQLVSKIQWAKDFTPPTPPPATLSLAFGGDGQFDRYIRQIGEEKGYNFILEEVQPLLKDVDGLIFNLEGPITDYHSRSVGTTPGGEGNYTFTSSPDILPTLKGVNTVAVNIGNNHITDFGSEGIQSTIRFLDKTNIKYFGNAGTQSFTATISQKGIDLHLVGYNQFSGEDPDDVVSKIQEYGSDGVVIVYAHWGSEYEASPTARQAKLARAFIDAGADLVLGAHPHVIQTHEVYKDRHIYYSLGNFVFDQYFNEDVRCGLVVKVKLSQGVIQEVSERTVNLKRDGRTVLEDC